jgi:acetyl esterase/lipase
MTSVKIRKVSLDNMNIAPNSIPLVMLVLVTFLGGCVTHQRNIEAAPAPIESFQIAQVVEDIVYTRGDWAEPLQADLYLPGKTGPHAVVLMIHGGGWAARHRDDMNSISRKLARHGYAVLNVSYRFAPAHTFPAQFLDLQQALTWLAENADRYGLDTTRINAWGYSSGAHLAALLASYTLDSEQLIGDSRELPRIRAVVAGGTPADLRKYSRSPLVMRFLGGARDELPALYAEASPAFHISADDPPVFLYHGKQDDLVTRDQAVDYYQALLANGIDAELYLHAWRGHATMFLFGGDAEDKAITFLNRKNAVTLTSGKDESTV